MSWSHFGVLVSIWRSASDILSTRYVSVGIMTFWSTGSVVLTSAGVSIDKLGSFDIVGGIG